MAMQSHEACLKRLATMPPSWFDDYYSLEETASVVEARQSAGNRKRSVATFYESHLDATNTLRWLVSPITKRRKVIPSPLLRNVFPRTVNLRDADKSLGKLARRFSVFLLNQPNHAIDVKNAAEILQVERRRLYDVINIFEGTGLVVPAEHGRYRWVLTQNQEQEQIVQDQLKQLHAEESLLDHWSEFLHAQSYVIKDDNMKQNLPRQETLFATVSPPGSRLLSDTSESHAVTIRIPTDNRVPTAFLIETTQHSQVNLNLEEAFMPTLPLLDNYCASGRYTARSRAI